MVSLIEFDLKSHRILGWESWDDDGWDAAIRRETSLKGFARRAGLDRDFVLVEDLDDDEIQRRYASWFPSSEERAQQASGEFTLDQLALPLTGLSSTELSKALRAAAQRE